jgi:ABC-type transport system substrate-binding protein
MNQIGRRALGGLTSLLALALLLAACGEAAAPEVVVVTATPDPNATPEVVVVTATPDPNAAAETETTPEVIVVTATPDPNAAETGGTFTTPHPILSDINVRRAIAYCTDRKELIESVYPFLGDEQKERMLMDTFIPQGHWAHTSEGITQYPFDPQQGQQLLEESGWVASEFEGEPRVNEAGEPLVLDFTTTNADFRQTWATVMERQLLENCGIQIIRQHIPGSIWFGNASGLQRRDFELGAFAWVGQVDPAGNTLYACNQIPRLENNWEGQNYMGWCNEEAHQAIVAATNVLDREQRKAYYATVQREFTKDMVSLPLFNRFEGAAASTNLLNFEADVSEVSYLINIHEWELQNGGDTVILGFTQEPASLFRLAEDNTVPQMLGDLLEVRAATGKGYDYQPAALTDLSTLENGRATLNEVQVSEGDMVMGASGEPVTLTLGVEVMDINNDIVAYEGEPLTLHQMVVNHEIVEGLTWEDGEPVKKADLELAHRINCDPESGAVSYSVCESWESYEVTSDTSITITYLPGAKTPEYMVYTAGVYAGTTFGLGAYPSHLVLSDGRNLADVPASEWSSLPEIALDPLSYGPYRLVEWQKGQRMVFEANPYYYLGEPKIKTVIAQFFGETNAAVAQILNGEVDVIGTETLGAGPELETMIEAGENGQVQFFPIASATWEHVDMNLFVR